MRIGIAEIIVIAIIAIAMVRPDKLPEYASKLGQLLAEVRKGTESVRKAAEPVEEAVRPVTELRDEINTQISASVGNVTGSTQETAGSAGNGDENGNEETS